jgi:hypothetical protein
MWNTDMNTGEKGKVYVARWREEIGRDNGILGIFSSPERAQAYCDRERNSTDNDWGIEYYWVEWTIDEEKR